MLDSIYGLDEITRGMVYALGDHRGKRTQGCTLFECKHTNPKRLSTLAVIAPLSFNVSFKLFTTGFVPTTPTEVTFRGVHQDPITCQI